MKSVNLLEITIQDLNLVVVKESTLPNWAVIGIITMMQRNRGR